MTERELNFSAVLTRLRESSTPFLIGGALALQRYVGTMRPTDHQLKDLDICVLRRDADRALAALAALGCRTSRAHPHWLAKAFCGESQVDIIYSSGNGLCEVDEEWFKYAVPDKVLGNPVLLAPPEETLWAKAFVMERERYDGADVAHLLRAVGHRLDWARLVRRFDHHWPVLFSHLVLYSYIYPAERDRVPPRVWSELARRFRREILEAPALPDACRGTLLSRAQYATDIERWGYRDERLRPTGRMTLDEIRDWTRPVEG